MVKYEDPREKNLWGVRCTEDADGNLWVGKVGSVAFNLLFKEIETKIKSHIREIRGSRTGVFWINPQSKLLTLVTDDSVETGDYPQCNY